jgi:septum formation protein
MTRLILASQSPYRLQLLRDAGYDVEAVPAGIDEPDLSGSTDLDADLFHVAVLKARALHRMNVRGLILAADTVGSVAGQVFGKPSDRPDALRMLRAISGTTHDVLTGWCLLRPSDGLIIGGTEKTIITMHPWTEDEFTRYLDSGEWIGKCGAYGLQLPHDPFVTRIEGSAANFIGLPLERLKMVLTEFGIHVSTAETETPIRADERR